MFEQLLEQLKTAVMATLYPLNGLLLDGKSRYFWVYCVAGVVIALAAYNTRGQLKGERHLFDREIWLSKSAQNDYFIVVFGAVLRLTVLSALFFSWKPIADFVVATLQAWGVSGTVNDSYALGLGVLLTLSLFLVDDFLKWAVHTVMHKVPELWEFHKVHHSAEELNFLTAERHHPFEIILTSLAVTIGFGLVNGLFIAFFGDKLTVQTVFGANIFMVVFNLAGGVLRHSPVWISFGPRIEKWVISPAMHQIHHSGASRHFDRNMGVSLAIWDRMAGTLHIPKERDITEFGIGAETKDYRSLGVIYIRPFIRAAQMIKARIVKPFSRPVQT